MSESKKEVQKYKKFEEMTPTQQLFYVGKIALAPILKKMKNGEELTADEKRQYDETMTQLFQSVRAYGLSIAYQKIHRYRKASDYRADIENSIALMFFEHFPDYDPRISAPTTFFKDYFMQAVSEYLHSNSQHLSPYDAKNVGCIRAAKNHFAALGVAYDEQLLSLYTGLSLKVVKNTLKIEENSTQVDVDDHLVYLATDTRSPSEILASEEKTKAIQSAIDETLDPLEKDVFFYRVNPDGTGQRSYREIAEYFDIDQKMARQLVASAVAKLNSNHHLRAFGKKRTPDRQYDRMDTTLHFSSSVSEEFDEVDMMLIRDADDHGHENIRDDDALRQVYNSFMLELNGRSDAAGVKEIIIEAKRKK